MLPIHLQAMPNNTVTNNLNILEAGGSNNASGKPLRAFAVLPRQTEKGISGARVERRCQSLKSLIKNLESEVRLSSAC